MSQSLCYPGRTIFFGGQHKVGPARFWERRGRDTTEGVGFDDAPRRLQILSGDDMTARETYYKLGPSIWLQPWDDDTRLAALYVLTSPHRTMEGLFRMPLDYAASDIGWPAKRFAKAFAHLVADGFVEYDDKAQVCLIVNALQWQRPANPNQRTAAVRMVARVPATPLLSRLHQLAQRFDEQFAEALAEEFSEELMDAFAEHHHSPCSSSVNGGQA